MSQPNPNGGNGKQIKRRPNGQFAPGGAGGPGRPRNLACEDLRNVLFEAVTPQRFRKVVEVLLSEAESGNVRAAELLLNRTLGKVVEQIRVDGPDPEERARIRARADRAMERLFGIKNCGEPTERDGA